MAISYSLVHGTESLASDNSTNVTQGTNAPGAGDVEVRVSAAVNTAQLEKALHQIIRFMKNQVISATGVPPIN